ncbi:hypothetical protein EMIHUDRAFT_198278 [Emiliania huxleyi CCMP1516]|uniref:Uncharacterized protein n=2 Tax=Emiliania huxleyi TaxID=2903 RepID=A0A0D3I6Z6_EMIH1|nr:hypothetical protein EMIHUDRAFT_198278 [Emiliania huxleyi CCMP1516]EOD07031.1 hypothetical protein EMIHUDRAFT_198278 [Emiliania huxleyi CCMP1516]|eukprot:XP_005759460.1 hypothetical protein EMIHUDRAFT_198278 [Emiliania huxleyi CCMP1516]
MDREEDENPPRATMAHVLSGACLGNREQARWFLRVARAQTGTAISKVAQAAPDSKDTLKTLRIAHVAALKGSRYRVLDEDGYDALAPAVGGVLPALVDVGLGQVFRKTKRKTEGPQHFAFPEISRENRGCLVLHSVSLEFP